MQFRRIKFPSHVIGRQYRSFSPSLYDKYLWLECSERKDAVYCFHCRHFPNERKEQTFVGNGMRNWKRCCGTKPDNSKLPQHHTSFQHAESVAAHAHYQNIKSGEFHSVAECNFAALVDESKHAGKKELVFLAVWHCLNNGIHKEFVEIAEAQSLDTEGLTDTIIGQLKRIDANMKNCVGQGYDGAFVVAGRLNGVQKKLQEKGFRNGALRALLLPQIKSFWSCKFDPVCGKHDLFYQEDTFVSSFQHCTCTIRKKAQMVGEKWTL